MPIQYIVLLFLRILAWSAYCNLRHLDNNINLIVEVFLEGLLYEYEPRNM